MKCEIQFKSNFPHMKVVSNNSISSNNNFHYKFIENGCPCSLPIKEHLKYVGIGQSYTQNDIMFILGRVWSCSFMIHRSTNQKHTGHYAYRLYAHATLQTNYKVFKERMKKKTTNDPSTSVSSMVMFDGPTNNGR